MKNMKLCIFLMSTLTYFVPFAMCRGQHIEIQKYMNKLKAYIKDSKRSLSSEQYTAFGVAKKGLTVNETLDIYQSLFGIPDRDGTMTVITIRNKNHSVIDSLEKCMESLVIAAQNFIYQKKQETFFDDLCVTIEYIQQDHIRDCGVLSEACRQIEKTKNNFEAYIVSNLLKITNNLHKHLIFLLMHRLLGERYKEFRIYINDNEKDKQEFVDWAYRQMVWRSKMFYSCELAEMASITPPDSFDSIFDELRSYILKYEKENDFYFFTGNDKEMIRFISKTLNKHGYFVWQNLILTNAEPHKFVINAENEKLLRNILGYVYTKLIEYISFKPRNNDKIARNRIWEKFVGTLNEDSEFISKYQEFFSNVTSEKLGILEAELAYPETVSEYAQEIRSDNAVRIIFTNSLEESILCRLCSILRSTKIYNSLYANQSIYINFDSELTQDKLTDSYLKFQASCNEEKSATADDNFKFVAIEVYTTSKQMTDDLNSKAKQLMSYKADSATVNGSNLCPICVKGDRPSNETIIAIETPGKHEEYIEHLQNLLNTSEKIDILNVILIENDFVKVRIYFIQEMADDMSEKMISISFEVTKKTANESTFECQQPDTLFKTMRDVDDHIMVSLFRFIQRYYLTIGAEFTVPNLKSIDGFDYIYTESIFDKPWKYFSDFLNKHVAKSVGCQDDTLNWRTFCNKDILDLKFELFEKSPSELSFFITKLGRSESTIAWDIREFVINRRIKEGSCKLHNTEFENRRKQNVAIYATYIRGDCLVLNICEVNKNAYINSLSTHSSKILAKVLTADFGCDALKALVNEAKTPKHKMLLISEMITSVYMQQCLNSLRKEEMSISTEKTKYIRMFGESLQAYIENQRNQENIKYPCQHESKNCLKAVKIKQLIDFVFKEIKSASKRRQVKVTSIRVGVKKDVPQKFFGLRCNIS